MFQVISDFLYAQPTTKQSTGKQFFFNLSKALNNLDAGKRDQNCLGQCHGNIIHIEKKIK